MNKVNFCLRWILLVGAVSLGNGWGSSLSTHGISQSVLAPRMSLTAVSGEKGGLLCQDGHTQELEILADQVHSLLNQVKDRGGAAEDQSLSESAVDQFYQDLGFDDFDFSSEREQIKEFLGDHLSANQPLPQIFFVSPRHERLLFWVNEAYTTVYYDEALNAIYLSLPFVKCCLDLQGPMAVNALAYHAFAHLSGYNHIEASLLSDEVDPELDTLMQLVMEEEKGETVNPNEDPMEGETDRVSLDESILVALSTAQIHLKSSNGVEWQQAVQLDRPKGMGREDPQWFQETIISYSDRDSRGELKEFSSALKEWELEITSYPYQMDRCSFGHPIFWGFNFYHPQRKVRIQLGQDEIVSFELLTQQGKEEAKREYQDRIRESNEQWPYLQNYLWIIRTYLEDLVFTEELDDLDRARLKAFAKISVVKGYFSHIEVLAQKIEYQQEWLTLSYQDLERFIHLASQLADEGRIELDRHKALPSELQRLRLQIATAVFQAQTGDADGWDRIAKKYSLLLENLSAFSIRVAALSRFMALLHHSSPPDAKKVGELKRMVFLGQGPADGLRALVRISSLLEEVGMDISQIDFHGFDFSQGMNHEADNAVAQINQTRDQPIAYSSHKVDIVNDIFPLPDQSASCLETGMVGTIGEEENELGIPKKMHLFLESNRILEEGGYLILTVKNRPLPQKFQSALKDYFGFRVMTKPNQELGYEDEVLRLITAGDAKKIKKLKSHLQGASYLIAVKEKTLTLEERELLLKNRAEIAKALEYDDSYEAQEKRAKRRGQVTQIEEVDLSQLDYRQLGVDQLHDSLPREEILYRRSEARKWFKEQTVVSIEEALEFLYELSGLLKQDQRILVIQLRELWYDPTVPEINQQGAIELADIYRNLPTQFHWQKLARLTLPETGNGNPLVFAHWLDTLADADSRIPPAGVSVSGWAGQSLARAQWILDQRRLLRLRQDVTDHSLPTTLSLAYIRSLFQEYQQAQIALFGYSKPLLLARDPDFEEKLWEVAMDDFEAHKAVVYQWMSPVTRLSQQDVEVVVPVYPAAEKRIQEREKRPGQGINRWWRDKILASICRLWYAGSDLTVRAISSSGYESLYRMAHGTYFKEEDGWNGALIAALGPILGHENVLIEVQKQHDQISGKVQKRAEKRQEIIRHIQQLWRQDVDLTVHAIRSSGYESLYRMVRGAYLKEEDGWNGALIAALGPILGPENVLIEVQKQHDQISGKVQKRAEKRQEIIRHIQQLWRQDVDLSARAIRSSGYESLYRMAHGTYFKEEDGWNGALIAALGPILESGNVLEEVQKRHRELSAASKRVTQAL